MLLEVAKQRSLVYGLHMEPAPTRYINWCSSETRYQVLCMEIAVE
jgi:hypothetical protein